MMEMFLDMEEFVRQTLVRENEELNCGACPEREHCINGEPVAIPCPAHYISEGEQDDSDS